MHNPIIKISLFHLRINVGQFRYVLCTAIVHNTRLHLSDCCIEKRLGMTFLTVNAHSSMLHVNCHRNLETTYLKDLEGGGASSRRLCC
jgi:hypothetical protein